MNSAPQSWEPPFCPNPKCLFHRGDTTLWRHVKIGFYFRRTPPYKIQRRRCVTCRRSFVASTFLPTYWLHRPELLVPVFHRLPHRQTPRLPAFLAAFEAPGDRSPNDLFARSEDRRQSLVRDQPARLPDPPWQRE